MEQNTWVLGLVLPPAGSVSVGESFHLSRPGFLIYRGGMVLKMAEVRGSSAVFLMTLGTLLMEM